MVCKLITINVKHILSSKKECLGVMQISPLDILIM